MLTFAFTVLSFILFAGLGICAYLYLKKELERQGERLTQQVKTFQSHMIRKRREDAKAVRLLQVRVDTISPHDKLSTLSLNFKENMEARAAREARQVSVDNGIPVQIK